MMIQTFLNVQFVLGAKCTTERISMTVEYSFYSGVEQSHCTPAQHGIQKYTHEASIRMTTDSILQGTCCCKEQCNICNSHDTGFSRDVRIVSSAQVLRGLFASFSWRQCLCCQRANACFTVNCNGENTSIGYLHDMSCHGCCQEYILLVLHNTMCLLGCVHKLATNDG